MDLSKGVIVVLSGGGFDDMNPPEVRARMDDYIARVNADPFVQANSGGQGLTFHLLATQTTKHLHQAQWRDICQALTLLDATPLIVVGHSNGGAAAMDLARCLQAQNKNVDLMISCDSVVTLDDIGDINKVPPNVLFNVNPYVIPTPAWILAPFPIGRRNRREANDSMDAILNIGLAYNLPGAIAHRDAFYHMAGGDSQANGTYSYPSILLDATLAVLQGTPVANIVTASLASLQTHATKDHANIRVRTTGLDTTLNP